MLFKHLPKLFNRAYDILDCDCKDPQECSRCTFLRRCSQNNKKLDKLGAHVLLSTILNDTRVPLGDENNQYSQIFH